MSEEEAAGTACRCPGEQVEDLGGCSASSREAGNASVQSIAKRAGIGQGTMYRHLATREELVLAVHRKDVLELVYAAPVLIREHPPLVALRTCFDLLASYGRIKLGLAGAIHSVMFSKLSDEGNGSVAAAINSLLDERQSGGCHPRRRRCGGCPSVGGVPLAYRR